MGKAARKKRQTEKPVDYLDRIKKKLCLHCGKRSRSGESVWCDNCVRYGQEVARGAKPAGVSDEEVDGIWAVLEELEAKEDVLQS